MSEHAHLLHAALAGAVLALGPSFLGDGQRPAAGGYTAQVRYTPQVWAGDDASDLCPKCLPMAPLHLVDLSEGFAWDEAPPVPVEPYSVAQPVGFGPEEVPLALHLAAAVRPPAPWFGGGGGGGGFAGGGHGGGGVPGLPSGGGGQPGSVPEPASWALALLGAGLAGLGLRRARRAPPGAADMSAVLKLLRHIEAAGGCVGEDDETVSPRIQALAYRLGVASEGSGFSALVRITPKGRRMLGGAS